MKIGRPSTVPQAVSSRTIGRLSLYRRMLYVMDGEGRRFVYSHQIATLTGATAAQVRRDLMATGYSGSPNRGYDTRELLRSIERFLYDPQGQNVVLVGAGNLGCAILAYFSGRRPRLQIVASFDCDAGKTHRVIQGCRCHPLGKLKAVVRKHKVEVGILTVPAAAAQAVADKLVAAGVSGIVNFAPVALRVPPHVYVEDIDLAMALEKVAFFSRQGRPPLPPPARKA